jgi:hypothetical protein
MKIREIKFFALPTSWNNGSKHSTLTVNNKKYQEKTEYWKKFVGDQLGSESTFSKLKMDPSAKTILWKRRLFTHTAKLLVQGYILSQQKFVCLDLSMPRRP